MKKAWSRSFMFYSYSIVSYLYVNCSGLITSVVVSVNGVCSSSWCFGYRLRCSILTLLIILKTIGAFLFGKHQKNGSLV